MTTPIFSPAQRLVKRGTDLLISLTIIILGFPVFAAIALAIKLDSKGPIIFRHAIRLQDLDPAEFEEPLKIAVLFGDRLEQELTGADAY